MRADPLVDPPVARALDVVARGLAEVRSADDEQLQAVRARLVAPPRPGRDPHDVPLSEQDDLVVQLHATAAAHDDIHLLLPPMRMAVREAITRRDALIAEPGVLELERLGREPELQLGISVEVGADILEVVL